MNTAFFYKHVYKHVIWVIIAGLAMVGFSADSASAEEQLTEITWAHSEPERVSRFVVMVSPTGTESADTRWIEVGKPTGQKGSGTVSFYTALIPISSDELISIGAIGNNGLLGAMSPWRSVPPSRPGQPLVVK